MASNVAAIRSALRISALRYTLIKDGARRLTLLVSVRVTHPVNRSCNRALSAHFLPNQPGTPFAHLPGMPSPSGQSGDL